MFVGRKQELEELEERWTSDRFEFIPIYGRRRVGKTRMLEEFMIDKQVIYFSADQFGSEINLANLNQAITHLIPSEESGKNFSNFEDAFKAVADIAKASEEPLVFIIDEYPQLAKSREGIADILQKTIDSVYQEIDNLLLILTGSQVAFMEEHVLSEKSPLHNSITGQIKILPLNFSEAHALQPRIPKEVFMTIYSLTGGIPMYLTMLDDRLSLKENILTFVLKKNTFLYEEPGNLLMQELRTPNRYNDIIAAIASGAGEVREIVAETGINSGPLTKYLETLIDLEIVERKMPLTEIGKNKPSYTVSDGLFRFWYRYVPKYKNFIENGHTELIWDKIAADLLEFTSITFENYCRDWLLSQNGNQRFGFIIEEVGSWWGNKPGSRTKGTELEKVAIVGLGAQKGNLLLGECQWRNEKVDVPIAELFLERTRFFSTPNKELVIFSKRGFTKELRDFATEYSIRLISLAEM
ncbi:ATP-binding protein [Enterococcus sp. AZ109]|uniref:ATP-binding protein n=1 Tax=Enterococcus sp. AZ109 TaxID=2774634 RepID=UPI003F283CAD